MARCGCSGGQQCLSPNPGNRAYYDETGCLYVADGDGVFAQASLGANFDLVPLTSGVWSNTSLTLEVPSAGTYELTCDVYTAVHTNIAADGGSAQVQISFRLYNDTAAAVVPNTQVVAGSAGSNRGGRYLSSGGSSVHEFVSPTVATTYRLQAMRQDLSSGAAVATAISRSAIRAEGTSLRYKRLA